MDKIYRCVITEIDPETDTEEVVLDENYTGLTLLADCHKKGVAAEVIMHDTVMNIATKLASGMKTAPAVRLAAMLMDLKAQDLEKKEDALLRSIMEDM